MVNRNCDVNLTNEERGKVVQIESMGKEVGERKKRYCEKDLLLKEVLEVLSLFMELLLSLYSGKA